MTNSNILIYQTEDGQTKIQTRLQDETVWLTQQQMSELFQKSRSTINEHIKNIYAEEELVEDATMKKFGNSEFSKKPTNFYNLDMIISMGYSINSKDSESPIKKQCAKFAHTTLGLRRANG